jgi:hypothetical protein
MPTPQEFLHRSNERSTQQPGFNRLILGKGTTDQQRNRASGLSMVMGGAIAGISTALA